MGWLTDTFTGGDGDDFRQNFSHASADEGIGAWWRVQMRHKNLDDGVRILNLQKKRKVIRQPGFYATHRHTRNKSKTKDKKNLDGVHDDTESVDSESIRDPKLVQVQMSVNNRRDIKRSNR